MSLFDKSVLLVEDSRDDYEVITRAFGKAQLDSPIVWCQSGEEALDFLMRRGAYKGRTGKDPGLILLDLNMPGLDGSKTLWKLKADKHLKKIPVAILSTSSDERNIRACYQMGASIYVQKSLSFYGFVEDIRQLKEYWLTLRLTQGGCV